IFDGFYELHVGLVGTCLLVLLVAGRQEWPVLRDAGAPARFLATFGGTVALAAIGLLGFVLAKTALRTEGDIVRQERNFYGVLKVVGSGRIDPEGVEFTAEEIHPGYRPFDLPYAELQLVHGRILHGLQLLYPDLRDYPTSYYTP